MTGYVCHSIQSLDDKGREPTLTEQDLAFRNEFADFLVSVEGEGVPTN